MVQRLSTTRRTCLQGATYKFGEETVSDEEVKEGVEDSSGLPRAARAVLASLCFKTLLNVIIVCNSITVGLEQSARVAGHESVLIVAAEHVFLVIYCIELSMHLIASGRAAFNDSWVVFDGILVALAILASWIIPALDSLFGIQDVSALSLALVLRTARLLRLARAVRLVKSFRQLWMLVFAFLSSAKIMAYVIIMLGFVLYIFSSVALELITLRYQENPDAPPEILELVDVWFPTLSLTMLTLLQFVCMDSIGSIYRPLIENDWALAFYFTGLILVVSIVLMNIVTAVIVNSALQQSADDAELLHHEEQHMKENLMLQLQAMFHRLDADSSGTVGLEELKTITGEDAQLLNQCSNFADVVDVFKALDIDGGGALNIDEFCEGLYEVSVSQTPIEIKRICKQLDKILELETALNRVSIALQGAPPAEFADTCSGASSPKDAWRKQPLETVALVANSSVEAVVQEAPVYELLPRGHQNCNPPDSPVKLLSVEMQMSEQRVLREIRTSFSTLQKLWAHTAIDLQPAGATPASNAPATSGNSGQARDWKPSDSDARVQLRAQFQTSPKPRVEPEGSLWRSKTQPATLGSIPRQQMPIQESSGPSVGKRFACKTPRQLMPAAACPGQHAETAPPIGPY